MHAIQLSVMLGLLTATCAAKDDVNLQITFPDGSTAAIPMQPHAKGGPNTVQGRLTIEDGSKLVGGSISWESSGVPIGDVQGSVGKTEAGKDVVVINGRLGESAGVGDGRRRRSDRTRRRRSDDDDGAVSTSVNDILNLPAPPPSPCPTSCGIAGCLQPACSGSATCASSSPTVVASVSHGMDLKVQVEIKSVNGNLQARAITSGLGSTWGQSWVTVAPRDECVDRDEKMCDLLNTAQDGIDDDQANEYYCDTIYAVWNQVSGSGSSHRRRTSSCRVCGETYP